MLMDVGYRFLCSLRLDSRRLSFSCASPRPFLFSSQSNSHNVNMDICSRFYWHGRQKGVTDDKLMNVLGELMRFGAVLNYWRSWISSSEYVAVRCMFHKSMAFASMETRDSRGSMSNDECNFYQISEDQQVLCKTPENGEEPSLAELSGQREKTEIFQISEDQQVLCKNRKHGEESSLPELNGQVEKIELSHAPWLNDETVKEHSLPSDFHEASDPSAECLTDVAVIVFDIETTGFKLSDDRIIEFAARDLAGGYCSTIQTLVNPERPVPLHATNVHGIRSNMVNNSSIPRWSEVAPVITKFVESRRILGGPVFLIAHNGKRFDVPFLLKEFERCFLEVPSWWQFIDSVPIAREAMKAKGEKGPLRLSALYEYYKLPYVGEAHRALADVHMLASVLQMLLSDLKMPFSEFLKKAFTTKDILRATLSNVDNLEDLSKEFDLSSELSMEAEDLPEASSPQYETVSNSEIPWDDIEAKGENEGLLMLEEMDSKQGEESDCYPITEDSSIANLSLLSECEAVHTFNNSYHLLKLSDIELSEPSSILKELLFAKSQRPDLLLLLQTGEFYQAFFEDAKKLSEMCDAALCAVRGDELADLRRAGANGKPTQS